ncbi:MAG: DUF1674 domain-containing protein [Alphaproteobacteria bacterium]
MSDTREEKNDNAATTEPADPKKDKKKPTEIGGPKGPEPTRYGDWERKGIISDF